MESRDVRYFKGSNTERRLPLFVKKNDDEGQEFYYLGDVTPDPDSFEQVKMRDQRTNVVSMNLNLDQPVGESLYRYITDTN